MASGFLGAALGGFGGSVVGGAVVQLLLDDKQFQAGMAKAKGETSTAATGFSKFSGAAAAGFAAIGLAAVAGIGTAIDAAREAQEAQLKLNNSIENSKVVSAGAAVAFTDQADALRDLTGTDDEAIIGAQAFLVQMGLTEQQVKQLTPLIVDLSAKLGVSLEAAAKAVGKSVNGTTGGLARMGVVVDKTAAKSDAYAATLKALGVAQGFAEERADQQPWLKLQAQFEELAETLGTVLLPVITGMAKALNVVIGPVKEFTDALTGADDAAKLFKGSLQEALPPGVDLGDTIDKLKESTRKAGESAFDYQHRLAELHHQWERNIENAELMGQAQKFVTKQMGETTDATRHVAGGLRRLANVAGESQKDFRDAVRGSTNFVEARWEDLVGQSKVTATQIIRQFRRALEAQANFAENTKTFGDKVREEFGGKIPKAAQEMIADLAQRGTEGAGIMRALAGANGDQIRTIISQWKRGEEGPRGYLRVLENLGTKVNALPNKKSIDVYVNVHTTGSGSTASDQNIADALARELAHGG